MATSTPGSQIFATFQSPAGTSLTIGASLGRGLWGQGDINGDGYNDLLINASFRQTPTVPATDQGVVYAVFGSENGFSQLIDLADPADWDGVQVFGEPGDSLGQLTSFSSPIAAVDLNNDGFDDVLIGAPQAVTSPVDTTPFARAIGIFGQASNDGSTVPDTVNLAALSPEDGFEIETFLRRTTGTRFEPIGDIDGDGVVEVALSTLLSPEDIDLGVPLNGGYVYVFDEAPQGDGSSAVFDLFGLKDDPDGDGPLSPPADGVVFYGEAGERAGNDVTALGDFNGDGIDDFAIARELRVDTLAGDGTETTGAVTVVFGRDGADPFTAGEALSALAQSGRGLQIIGPDGDEVLGKAIAGIGDVNNDGLSDLAAISFDPTFNERDRAFVYIIYGTNEGGTLDLRQDPATMDDGMGGQRQIYTRLEGFGDIDAFIGPSDVKGLGDVDGDGVDDFAIGTSLLTSQELGGPANTAGAAVLIFGQPDFGDSFDIQSLNGTNGYRIGSGDPTVPASLFGSSIAALGDIDNDAAADFAIGAPSQRQVQGGTVAGAFGVVYVMHGGAALALYDAADGATDGFISFENVGIVPPVRFGFLPEGFASFDESDGIVPVTLVRSDPTGTASVTVTTSGTASTGTDYEVLGSQTVEFADGATEAQFSVRLLEDSLNESDETIVFGIGSITTDADFLIDQSNATGTILIEDGDTPVTFGFSEDTLRQTVRESDGRISLTLTRSDFVGDESVRLSFSGDAARGSDFQPVNDAANFFQPLMTASVFIDIVDDDAPEGDEVLVIGIDQIFSGNSVNVDGERATANIIIEDDDDPVVYGFRAGPSLTLTEGQAPTPQIFIERSNGVGAATVNLGIGGSAELDVDYAFAPGTSVEFADGVLATTVNVRPLVDSIPDPDVDVILTIENVTTDFLFTIDETRNTQQIVIQDDGDTLLYSLGDGVITPERPGQTDITFPVFRSHGLNAATVDLDFGGTAIEWDGSGSSPTDVEADYQVISTPVFAEGETEAQLTLRIFGDYRDEDDETIDITIEAVNDQSNVSTRIGAPSTSQVVIADSNSPNTYSLGEDVVVAESDIALRRQFVIERSLGVGTAQADIIVERISGGTDPIRVQFELDPENLQFADGETRIEVPFRVLGNLSIDETDVFRVTLRGVDTAVGTTHPTALGDTELIVRVPDNDQTVSYQLEVPESIGEADGGGFVDIVRDDPRGTAAVRIAVTDGTATFGEDYTFDLSAPSFDFRDGEDRIRVPFDVLDNRLVEQDERFLVRIVDVTPGTDAPSGSDGIEPVSFPAFDYEVTILDDDTVSLNVGRLSAIVLEGEETVTFDVPITRDNTAGVLELQFAIPDAETASIGTDYNFDGSPFQFEDGQAETFMRVNVLSDGLVEPDESILLTLLGARYEGQIEWYPLSEGPFSVANNRTEIEVRDFDVPVTYSMAPDFTVSELNKPANFSVTVTRDRSSGELGETEFAIQLLGSVAAEDYVLLGGATISGSNRFRGTFEPGETTSEIQFQMVGDQIPEPDETLILHLIGAQPEGATRILLPEDDSVEVTDNQTKITFIDDDPEWEYVLGPDVLVIEGDEGSSFASITASRSFTGPEETLWFTPFSTEADPTDYEVENNRVGITFAAGAMVGTGMFEIFGDRKSERNEAIDFQFASRFDTLPGTELWSLDRDTFKVTILDDDLSYIRASDGAETHDAADGDGFSGTPEELDDDTITGFGVGSKLVYEGVSFTRSDLKVSLGSAILDVDTDGDGGLDTRTTLTGDFTDGDFMVVGNGPDSEVSYVPFFPEVGEGTAIGTSPNGIANTDFLIGDGLTGFRVSLTPNLAAAGFSNSLGVYEIDASGNLVDARILIDDVKGTPSVSVDITEVEAGHQLGFFIIQDGAAWSSALGDQDIIAFNTMFELLLNGTDAGQTVFHSNQPDWNQDGMQHAISGVAPGGEGLVVGFEDLAGLGDSDFQDVVFTVEQFDSL